MNWEAWLASGFGATVLLTVVQAVGQGVGLSRIDLPFLLGSMTTPHRDRARVAGVLLHFVIGQVLALVYCAFFEAVGRAGILMGTAVGLAHGLFVLSVAMPALPGLHPRMASEDAGPTRLRVLEPPGFMALHYGHGTPTVMLIAHAIFGAVLGAFYRVVGG